jgi:Cu/Ag efflux protein CusF
MKRNVTGLLGAVALAALLVSGISCGGGSEPGQTSSEGADSASSQAADAGSSQGVDVYTVRGEITQLPDPDREGSELMVRHEPMPEFKNAKGEVVGMGAMTMPFPLAEGVSVDGLSVGDKVSLTFEVQFEPSTSFQTTQITKLPEGTELDFAGGAHGDHDHEGHDHEGHDHDH